MVVMKFGGTSVGSRERLNGMASLVRAHHGPVVLVVSAMAATTDALLQAGVLAAAGDGAAADAILADLRNTHLAAADAPGVQDALGELLESARSLLQGIRLLKEQTPRSRALLASYGERLSVHVAAAALIDAGVHARPMDAREFVRTDETWEAAQVDLEETRAAARAALLPLVNTGTIPVVTGFLGATAQGVTTVLGRSGSDYSAALLGQVLDASEVVIWTDVEGILTADPRLVTEARSLPKVSYREAAEMSYFGAKVLHPKTMLPCEQQGIPIRIRSTFAPDHLGTVVSHETGPSPHGVKVVTAMADLSMITLEGRGMAGLPGVSRRIFEVSEAAGVNILMISQASSEQTVSVVVRSADAAALQDGLAKRLRLEIEAGLLQAVDRRDGIAVLSIIGAGMAGLPGVSGRLFTAIGAAGLNVRAIAQGGSELSISVALDADTIGAAVRAVHTAFGLTRTVNLVLVGKGRVAQSLLGLLDENRQRLLARGLDFRVVAALGSTKMAFNPAGIAPADVVTSVSAGVARPTDGDLVATLQQHGLTDVVLVDMSAAPLEDLHRTALTCGMHVVTANKIPLSGSMSGFQGLMDAQKQGHVRYGYETTFGAGLPVLHTLQELVATGDELRKVEGCFSGTLGFLCTRLDEGALLSEAVEEARSLGYTEPDPREDLSGRDVARKALIVARSIGHRIEPDDVVLESFVDGLELGLVEALQVADRVLAERWAAARAEGNTVRFVASIEPNRVRVGLQDVPLSSPVGSLHGPDNILVFTTRRYDHNPLVVRGPGAGAEVTAAGVLGDLLRIQR